MELNSLNKVIQKFQALFPDDHGIPSGELSDIENKLQICLPRDFKEVCKYYSGGMIGGQSIFTFSADKNDDYGLVYKNLIYREKIKLPHTILALYDEYGFIYMETDKYPDSKTPIIDCSPEDVCNLWKRELPKHIYAQYDSFTDFFAYLLEQEEQERKSNKS